MSGYLKQDGALSFYTDASLLSHHLIIQTIIHLESNGMFKKLGYNIHDVDQVRGSLEYTLFKTIIEKCPDRWKKLYVGKRVDRPFDLPSYLIRANVKEMSGKEKKVRGKKDNF